MLPFQRERSLKEFSTFGIGGPIRLFAEILSVAQIEEIFCQFIQVEKIPFLILGKGSNCLFDDRGFDGLVLLNKLDHCDWQEDQVTVGSGYSFSLLGVQSARKGFSGLEFASGIPATVGGAIFMNAGANGMETCESLRSVLFLTQTGEKILYQKEDLVFGYRSSSFQEMKGVILSATFFLKKSLEARSSQLQILDYRIKTQPYKEKSVGCIFRNPSSKLSAGKLIEQCGLKGIKVGDAKVSEMHANFIVNINQATAKNVLELIEIIKTRVAEQTGVHLEPEIRVIHDARISS